MELKIGSPTPSHAAGYVKPKGLTVQSVLDVAKNDEMDRGHLRKNSSSLDPSNLIQKEIKKEG